MVISKTSNGRMWAISQREKQTGWTWASILHRGTGVTERLRHEREMELEEACLTVETATKLANEQ
jgi:hypothetical protein